MSAPISWLQPGDSLPAPELAWGQNMPAPGLLAAGGSLGVEQLCAAYSQGTFPWFSTGQPILWWAPDPRMVLPVNAFRVRRSLRKKIQAFRHHPGCEIRVNHSFHTVISACATTHREGQDGTWIVPDMVDAYTALHAAGYAHSVETWVDGVLVGGLYCVALGQAVFGESMFAHASDASKIALAALVCICQQHGVDLIDCQQNTRHLASLGAHEISRSEFLAHTAQARLATPVEWRFEPLYWEWLLPKTVSTA